MVIVMNEGTRFDTMIDLDDPVVGTLWLLPSIRKDELRLNIDKESIRDIPADSTRNLHGECVTLRNGTLIFSWNS